MKAHDGNTRLREAIVAGIFYPEDPAELSKLVDGALSSADGAVEDAIAILSPHASYDYCAGVQAAAWKAAIGRRIEHIVILAPYHRSKEASAFLPESDVFRTPLGDVSVNHTLCQELESCSTIFEVNDIPHFEEHSVELQLPFLARLFPESSIVPLLVGKTSAKLVSTLAKSLDVCFGPRLQSTLFVVSANLSAHLEPAAAARNAEELLGFLEAHDASKVLERGAAGDLCSCGSGCIAALLSMESLAHSRYRLLARSDSGHKRESQADHVVQYAAAAWRPAGT